MNTPRRNHTSTAEKNVYGTPSLKDRLLKAKTQEEIITLQKEAFFFTEAPLKWHKKIARVADRRLAEV
jgi:hypothetical protein